MVPQCIASHVDCIACLQVLLLCQLVAAMAGWAASSSTARCCGSLSCCPCSCLSCLQGVSLFVVCTGLLEGGG
jgi:hypothetical protein